MTRQEFKVIYRWLRMITGARLVGTYGHLSDIVEKHGVTMEFLRELRELRKPMPRIVYGKYSKEYQEAAAQRAAWDSYYEGIVGA